MSKKKWSSEEKQLLVMEMLSGKKVITQLCKEYGVNDSVAYKWRDVALEGMKSALSGENKSKNVSGEAEKERLLKIIGEQTVAIDYQKKISQRV
jgi:transposase